MAENACEHWENYKQITWIQYEIWSNINIVRRFNNIIVNFLAGCLGTIFQFLIVTGILYSYTIGAFMTYVPFCLLCGLWVLLHLAGALCIPESPYYLISKNDPDRAAASLKTLRDSSDTTDELNTIKVR